MTDVAQSNLASTRHRGTIRGMHYQLAPYQETKIVRCTRGAIWDVIIDLRPDSATYLKWFGVELSADNHRQLYVPKDFAHGYQALVDDSETAYQVSEFYTPNAEAGIRWNDPLFAINWPLPAGPDTSAKDRTWVDFQAERDAAPAGHDAAAVGAKE